MVKNYKIVITVLLIVLIGSVGFNIYSGIWLWNKEDIFFDSSIFNNILTPLFSGLAVLVYGITLLVLKKQNNILHSQNIKHFFEKDLEELISEAKLPLFKNEYIDNPKEYNLINYVDSITEEIIRLSKDSNFISDYKEFVNKKPITRDYILKASYYDSIFYLSNFMNGFNHVDSFYNKVLGFIKEVNDSKLIPDDKKMIKRKVSNKLIEHYMSFIDFHTNTTVQVPLIPNLYNLNHKDIEYVNILETQISKRYDDFKRVLSV